jgi:hypothetical protein
MKQLRKSVAAAAFIVAAVTAQSAHAGGSMERYSQTGAWTSMAGTNNGGHPQCVTMVFGKFDNSFASLSLKYDAHIPNALLIHMNKDAWKIPPGTRMRVRLQIDNAPARVFEGLGSGDLVQISIDADETADNGEPLIKQVFNLLSAGVQASVSFPDGNEVPWVAKLNGSAAELGNFVRCMKSVISGTGKTQPYSSGGGATQPFSNGGNTQPFSNGGNTQPFSNGGGAATQPKFSL